MPLGRNPENIMGKSTFRMQAKCLCCITAFRLRRNDGIDLMAHFHEFVAMGFVPGAEKYF